MKKPKKNRKYAANGCIFDTFKKLKNYMYFNMSTKMKKNCYELDEDVITKKYIFTKQERRLICEKIYDKDLEELEKWKEKQLKLFEHENHRDTMDRNYPSYFDRDNCDNYDALRTKLHNEFKRSQE